LISEPVGRIYFNANLEECEAAFPLRRCKESMDWGHCSYDKSPDDWLLLAWETYERWEHLMILKDGLAGDLDVRCYTSVLYHADRLGHDDRYMIPFFVERRRYNDNIERNYLSV
jgi:hypothetical protein